MFRARNRDLVCFDCGRSAENLHLLILIVDSYLHRRLMVSSCFFRIACMLPVPRRFRMCNMFLPSDLFFRFSLFSVPTALPGVCAARGYSWRAHVQCVDADSSSTTMRWLGANHGIIHVKT